MVRELAARGAGLDIADPETGSAAFHYACGYDQPECAAAMVDLGCDTAMRDKDGQTGMEWAEDSDHAVLLHVLCAAIERRSAREAERAAAAQREEVGRLIARQAFGAAAPLLARMLRDAPADAELLAWGVELAAGKAEAEATAEANAAALLAELEAEGSGGGSAGQSKSQKKKEKQRRQKEAAALRLRHVMPAAAAAATAHRVQEARLQPEPELQMPADVDVAEPPSPSEVRPDEATSTAPGGKRRRKKNKKKGPQPRPAAGAVGGIDIKPAQVRKTPSWPRSWANFSLF